MYLFGLDLYRESNYQKALDIVPNDDLRAKLDALNNAKNHLFDQYFNQGIILAYGFNHEEAFRSFKEVARLDSNCAMAFWGMAYVLGPNINLGTHLITIN